MSALPASDSPFARKAADQPDAVLSSPNGTEGERRTIGRSASSASTKVDPTRPITPSRGGTLKRPNSLRKRASLSRSMSKRSLRAGSMKGYGNDEDDEGFNNVFQTPIPTQGNPTEVLANRFQAWRKLLKDLITYFREIQSSYEHRGKAFLKVSNTINNTQGPNIFLTSGGLNDALNTLRNFHKISLTEATKSKDIEEDVITQLNGLRTDLSQKIKEIKSLSGDFKNSVDKERDGTRKAFENFKNALSASESDSSMASGKSDPFIVRLAVDRQVERQIEEENYLHRAYLNLEGSGRELESIVVGEIQKAYNAYAGILRRETEHGRETIDDLRSGPIAMPKDQEWTHFVESDEHFINPDIPLRRLEDIYYPGKFNSAACEIRGGMLERKSKYLKSYTPGWYVLSPTHLHEFKSADHIHTQQPVMSLYLNDQKLGSRSQPGASSHKFSLKGRQTGGMHRGHSWVFRAESYDTMLQWYDDIRNLTEKTGAEKTAFVRRHARSISAEVATISSDGMEDEDSQPYGAIAPKQDLLTPPPKRPSPGGRFPSDVDVGRGLTAPLPPSSTNSNTEPRDAYDGAVSHPGPSSGKQYLVDSPADSVERRDYIGLAAAPVVAPSALDPAPMARQRPSESANHQNPQSTIQPTPIVTNVSRSDQQPLPSPAPSTAYPQELPAHASPPSKPSAFNTHAAGNATHDYAPALAATGGAIGGASAYSIYQNHQTDKDSPLTRATGNPEANEYQNQGHAPDTVDSNIAAVAPVAAAGTTSNASMVDGAYTSTNPNTPSKPETSHQRNISQDRPLHVDYASPEGVYPEPVTDYTSPTHTEVVSPAHESLPTPEPTLPDLNSAAFAGTGARAVNEPHAAEPNFINGQQDGSSDMQSRDELGDAMLKRHATLGAEHAGTYDGPPVLSQGSFRKDQSFPRTADQDDAAPLEATPILATSPHDTQAGAAPNSTAFPQQNPINENLLSSGPGPEEDASSVATTPRADPTHGQGSDMHETGYFLPTLLRHDTSTTISQLHVPGEFPPPTPAE